MSDSTTGPIFELHDIDGVLVLAVQRDVEDRVVESYRRLLHELWPQRKALVLTAGVVVRGRSSPDWRALAREAGAAAAEAWLGYMAGATPDSPLQRAERAILDLAEVWGHHAAQQPREKGDPQHRMLEAVKVYLVAKRQAEDEGCGV